MRHYNMSLAMLPSFLWPFLCQQGSQGYNLVVVCSQLDSFRSYIDVIHKDLFLLLLGKSVSSQLTLLLLETWMMLCPANSFLMVNNHT